MNDSPTNLVRFLHIAGNLKKIKRRGWIYKNVASPESVADHTFRLCLFVFTVCRQHKHEFNSQRCLEMALVHDLAESIVGDIAPSDGTANVTKYRAEKDAILELSNLLDDDIILDLWEEYEAAHTDEAKIVHDLDIIESVLQSLEYADFSLGDPMFIEFMDTARNTLSTSLGQEVLEQIASSGKEEE
jgi:putative hydrolase of HD superfamily